MPDQIPAAVRRKRRETLDKLALSEAEKVRRKFIGRRMPVLVETIETNFAIGLTPNYLRVRWPATADIESNTFVDVQLESVSGLNVFGRADNEAAALAGG